MMNQFANIGMGTVVQKQRVLFITSPQSTTAQRYIEVAKKHNKYHNATLNHKYRSVIVMDEGTVIISPIKPMTLMRRFNDVEGVDEEMKAEEKNAEKDKAAVSADEDDGDIYEDDEVEDESEDEEDVLDEDN